MKIGCVAGSVTALPVVVVKNRNVAPVAQMAEQHTRNVKVGGFDTYPGAPTNLKIRPQGPRMAKVRVGHRGWAENGVAGLYSSRIGINCSNF